MKAGYAQQDVEMLDITGAGAQPPMRSYWKLRPGPQSHKKTASSNTSATGQTQSQQTARQAPQGKHSHSKQQGKRYTANGPATATGSPVPPPQLSPLVNVGVTGTRLAPPQYYNGHPLHQPRRHSPRPSSDDLAQSHRHYGVVCSY